MALSTSGGLLLDPLVAGAYLLAGDGTISGTGSTSITATAAGTLTVTGAATVVDFTNITAAAVIETVVVTGGATATVDALTGITALSTFQIGDGSTLKLGAGITVAALPQIDFGMGSGTLEVANGALNVNIGEQITNFGTASTIVFDGVVFTGGSYASGALTLTTAAGATAIVPLAADSAFTGGYFHLLDVGGSTSLVLNTNAVGGIPACYVRGTRVLTDQGERAVEDLVIGDRLVTLSGGSRALRWIGIRSYAGRFLAGNPGVRPVRITAGALAPFQPKRDLLVSPAHAMLLDGVLIPAQALVNGTSIVVETGLSQVDYVHLELDSHDVIWAEGAPSETYLEDDNRGSFHNAASYEVLYPGTATKPAEYCAAYVESGYVLETIRLRIDRLAASAPARRPEALAA